MGFFNEITRRFIAVPDSVKGQILFKWPDDKIRKGSRAIVDADEQAVFFAKGQIVGNLGPGQHLLEAGELPFLGSLVDLGSAGNAYRTEIYFVGTREYTGIKFGGRIDNVQDAHTGLVVTLRVFGDCALRVSDPSALILTLTGTVDVEDNETVTDWINTQTLKVIRTEVTRQIVRNGWPILGLSAYTPDLEEATLTAANAQLERYGLHVTRMGNFDLNLATEDEDRLKDLAGDTAYTRLAGGFTQMAAGKALLGAGEGMAEHGGTNPFMTVAGLGLGQTTMGAASQPGQQVDVPPAPGFVGGHKGATPGVSCNECGTPAASGARFCASCGARLQETRFCTVCGEAMAAEVKFCGSCGTPRATERPTTQSSTSGDSPYSSSPEPGPTTQSEA